VFRPLRRSRPKSRLCWPWTDHRLMSEPPKKFDVRSFIDSQARLASSVKPGGQIGQEGQPSPCSVLDADISPRTLDSTNTNRAQQSSAFVSCEIRLCTSATDEETDKLISLTLRASNSSQEFLAKDGSAARGCPQKIAELATATERTHHAARGWDGVSRRANSAGEVKLFDLYGPAEARPRRYKRSG